MIIAAFNPPQQMADVQEVLFHTLHAGLRGLATVGDGGDGPTPMVSLVWDEATGDAVDDGVVIYLTDRQYTAYRRAIEDGRLSLPDPEQD